MFLYTKNKLKNFLKNMFVSQKSKRVFIIALLFFVFCGVVAPKLIFAAGGSWYLNLLPFGVGGVMDLALSAKSSMSEGFYNAIIYGASSLGVAISGSLFGIAVGFFKWVISDSFVSFSYTGFDNPVVASGWPIVRDFANIIVILGFVVIGIATIVRYKSYEAGKILVPLIIAAILINFSLIFCGIIIDGSNLGMKFFLSGGASGDGIFSGFTKVVNDQKAILMSPDDSNPIQFAGKMTAMMLNYTIQAMIFALYGCLFMFRYIALWILVTLSPLAFVCYVFPATKKVFSMWWSNFIAWCIIGISGAFFVYLSDRMVSVLITTKKMVGFGDIGFADLTVYLVPAGLLVFGFLISLQTSAMGANFITSRARGLYNKGTGMLSKGVTGGAKLAGSKISGATGVAGLYSRTKNKITMGLEGAGMMTAGITSARKDKAISAFSGELKNARDEQLLKLATGTAISEKDKDRKAAAIVELRDREKINLIPASEREKAVNFAISRGGNSTEKAFAKGNPDLVTGITNKDAIERLKKEEVDRMVNTGGIDRKQAEKYVNENYASTIPESVIAKTRADMKDEKEKQIKLGYSTVTKQDAINEAINNKKNELITSGMGSKEAEIQASAFAKSLSDTDIENIRKEIQKIKIKEKSLGYESATFLEGRQKLINDQIDELRKLGLSGSEIDSEIKKFEESLTFKKIDNSKEELSNGRKVKAIKKLTVPKLRELSKLQIDQDILENVNSGTFDRAYLEFTTEQKDECKKFLNPMKDKLITELGIPKDSKFSEIKKIIEKLKNSKDKTEREKGMNMGNLSENIETIYL